MSSGSRGATWQHERSCGGGGGKTLLLPLALLALAAAALAAIIAADFTTVQAQSDEQSSGQIIARRTGDGQIEFGWRTPSGAQISPRQRFFSASAEINEWLRSSPIIVEETGIGRINARLLTGGGIEFAFTPTGGRRILPPARFFHAHVTHNRWLRSTEIELPQPTRAAMKDVIVAALFGYDAAADADRLTYHDYNDFGCPLSRDLEPAGRKADCDLWGTDPYRSSYEPGWQWMVRDARGNLVPVPGYIEGHSGWDIQTQTKGSEPFYSLTSGRVVAAGDLSDGLGQFGVIAVQVAEDGPTVVYIHASAIDKRIRVNASVRPGDCLGRQGATGTTSGAHVHLELRDGPARGGSGGAYWLPNGRRAPNSPSIDPINHLYRSLSRSSFEPQPCQFDSSNGVGDGDLIRSGSSPDVYVVKVKNGKQFRRAVVAYGLYAAVPEWNEANVQSISGALMDDIRESPLVNLPAAATRIHGGDTNRIYFVEEMGEDDIVLRHIPSVAIFNSAGCDWDGIFAMSRAEHDYWVNKLGSALSGSPVDSGFKCPP